MQDDSCADRTSMSGDPFRSYSPKSMNPFEKAHNNVLFSNKEGPGRDKKGKESQGAVAGNQSIKSQSLFSN